MFILNNIVKAADLSGYYAESKPCPTCNYTATVFVTPPQMFAYNQGAYIQNVLPDYDNDTRERFISGYCGECWNAMFSNDDFEDYEYQDTDPDNEEYIDYYAEASLFGWEN